ncbi:MAG: GTP-dependent dephospho-CoA kinase family protein [archaeon]|nr:GTP-dependent dephospho-CoA kinase family protein [archaeon]
MTGRRIPEGKKEIFKEILGRDLKENDLSHHNDKRMITIGDMVSLTVRKKGMRPLLSIYDGYTERHIMTEFSSLVKEEKKRIVRNPAGVITNELNNTIKNSLKTGDTNLIYVEGEEDLAFIPCVLHSPNDIEVVYGCPGRGMMVVSTDIATKKKVEELWKQMEEFE